MSLLSVIIPFYNGYDKTIQCLKSFEEQIDKDFQIILISDGSNESNTKKIESYINNSILKKNIKFILYKENKGPGFARNIGVENATTKYITFVDSDDTVSEYFVLEIKKILTKKNIDLLIFDYNFVNNNIKYPSQSMSNFKEGYINTKEAIALCYAGSAFKVYRKKILIDNDIKYLNQKFCEDIPFGKCAISYCKNNYYLKKKIYNYINNSDSLVHKVDLKKHLNCMNEAMNYISNKISDEYNDEKNAVFIKEFFYGGIMLMAASNIENKEIKKFIIDKERNNKIYTNSYINKFPIHIKLILFFAKIKFIYGIKIISYLKQRKWK